MNIDEAKAYADSIGDSHPELADLIDASLVKAEQVGALTINVEFHAKLEKFDGDYAPGAVPVETIESTHTL